MDRFEAMRRLLSPQTAAFIGGNGAAAAIRQTKAVGFAGEIFAVNPNRESLGGVPCHDSLADLPAPPDAAFIAAPPAASIEIVRELAASGAGGAVCYASGFAELGGDGERLQDELRAAAGDMPVIGPNCHGFVNYLDGVALWPDEHGGTRSAAGVALITQSGNFGINLSMQRRGIEFAYVITVGNRTCIALDEYIDYLLTDERVTAIGLHLESIDRVHEFSVSALRALEKGVPIVAIKTGRSEKGAKLNVSHTASLAGEDRLYDALFDRVGVARAATVPQFLETLKFVSTVGALPVNTVGSMSCSGGEASLAADAADALGLDMPPLSEESEKGLHEVLGPKVPLSNPLDYHTYIWGDYEKLTDCFSTMLGNGYACTMLVIDYPTPEGADTSAWELAERALAAAIKETRQRAVIVSSIPETMPQAARDRLLAAGITPMQGIEDCLFAIRAAARIGLARAKAATIQPVMKFPALAGEPRMLDEWASKQELEKAGIPVPRGILCAATETTGAAEKIGYPVVLKAVSTDLAHKSEAGAVAVNLADEQAVAAATEGMAMQFDRFLVEKMVAPIVAELIVGLNRDPDFGLTLLIGAGGTLVELVDDTASLLLPTTEEDIRNAIESLKVVKLISAYRGGAAGDLDAVVETIRRIADYAVAMADRLVELDVNPLVVQASGAVAVDALIRQRR
jgi:acyl-CoA synthetase (NDP forming)